MKAVLISINPKYCELIASGKKTIEVRKSEPKLEPPFKCYIYCTKPKYGHEDFISFNEGTEQARAFYGGGRIIGEFICDYIFDLHDNGKAIVSITDYDLEGCCLNYNQLHNYANGKTLFGWHISNLIIYDEPKELSEFRKPGGRLCVSDNGLCCKYIQASPGDDPADVNTLSCIYGEQNCPFEYLSRPPQSWCYVEERVSE